MIGSGALLPTQDPFLYSISLTATDGVGLQTLEEATLSELDAVRAGGITEAELVKGTNQLRARLVFENDSVTNIGHQLGFFETVASWKLYESLWPRIQAVTIEEVSAAAEKYLKALLQELGAAVPRTHDMEDLLDWLLPHDATLAPLRRGVSGLTKYAVEYRYPGQRATTRQMKSALRIAGRVRREIRGRLGLTP